MSLVTKWLLFRCQLESVFGSVLNHWFESNLDSSLIVGNESAEYFFDSAPFAGFLKDLEVVKKSRTTAGHIEDAAAGSALPAVMRAKESLSEIAIEACIYRAEPESGN
jgi:hypothetical protein